MISPLCMVFSYVTILYYAILHMIIIHKPVKAVMKIICNGGAFII